MGIDFNICQIFDIADELERDRSEFFRRASEKFSDKIIQNALLEIAEQSKYNADVFARIREGFSSDKCPMTVFDPDNVDHQYLKAMADDHLCNFEACKNLAGNETLEQIFQMVIKMEKDALAFYSGLKSFVKKSAIADVDLIIKAKRKNIGSQVKKLRELK